jgi:hypothetical protein
MLSHPGAGGQPSPKGCEARFPCICAFFTPRILTSEPFANRRPLLIWSNENRPRCRTRSAARVSTYARLDRPAHSSSTKLSCGECHAPLPGSDQLVKNRSQRSLRLRPSAGASSPRQGSRRGVHVRADATRLEGLLYRLSQFQHAGRFVLKGAMLSRCGRAIHTAPPRIRAASLTQFAPSSMARTQFAPPLMSLFATPGAHA